MGVDSGRSSSPNPAPPSPWDDDPLSSPWDADPRWHWESLHLAYHFELIRRTQTLAQQRLTAAELRQAKLVFEPGEIAHVSGGLNLAFLHFLEARGYELNMHERALRKWLGRRKSGKYCVVVERVNEDTYWVCYITSFGDCRNGRDISSPVGRYFGLALGDTPPWPPDLPTIDTNPHWEGGAAYIVAMPVLRRGLASTGRGSFRHMLQAGALERVRQQVMLRVQNFERIADRIRHETTQRNIDVARAGGPDAVDFTEADERMRIRTEASVAEHVSQSRAHFHTVREEPVCFKCGVRGHIAKSCPEVCLRCGEPGHSASWCNNERKPRIHEDFLEPPPIHYRERLFLLENPGTQQDLKHLLRHLRHDITESYCSLSNDVEGTRAANVGRRNWDAYQRTLVLIDRIVPETKSPPGGDPTRQPGTLLQRLPRRLLLNNYREQRGPPRFGASNDRYSSALRGSRPLSTMTHFSQRQGAGVRHLHALGCALTRHFPVR